MIVRLLITAFAAIALANACDCAAAQGSSQQEMTPAAAKKKVPSARRPRRGPEYIACTVLGCHPTPPGCHPEIGYYPNGLPTGFDIVVCP